MRDPRRSRSRLLLAAALLLGPAARGDDPPAPATATSPANGPSLHLADGGYVAGAPAATDRPGAVRWQSPAFAGPLEFPLDAVASIHFPAPKAGAKPAGDSSFELAGGDLIFGTLEGLDAEAATIDAPPFGRLRVARSALRRIDRRRDGSDLVYLGPNGLSGWSPPSRGGSDINFLGRRIVNLNGVRAPQPPAAPAEPPPPNGGWREEGGQLATDHEGASIRSEFALPARAVVEFEVSWTKRPDFVISLGDDTPVSDKKAFRFADDPGLPASRAFRFEVWGDDLVALREGEREADVAPLQAVADGPGRAHLVVHLDAAKGRMLVSTPGGKRLAEIQVADPKPPGEGRVRLANVRGDVRLESLRVARWAGDAPQDVAEGARVRRADGSVLPGQVVRYDPATREFVVRDGDKGETRVGADSIAGVSLSAPADAPPRAVRASYGDGTRISGDLARVEPGAFVVKVPGVEAPVRLPVVGLRSLASIGQGTATGAVAWTPRLEMDGVRLRGELAEARASGEAGCVVWKPAGATAGVPLRAGASGRIVFREPPPPKPKAAQGPQTQQVAGRVIVRRVVAQPVPPAQPANVGVKILNALAGQSPPGQPPRPAPPATGPLAIHLRTGDVIPAEIAKIDEQGVSFKSTVAETTFIPHEKIKAVELARDEPQDVRLTKAKRERLLTLPRMQKGSPPTHLIRSKNGDYLRGRIVAMDDKRLEVEVHLETKEVPRDRVARVIWFHADELDPAKAPPRSDGPPGSTRVQALRRDGIRLTFHADRMADGALAGKSDVLGACKVALDEVDQFLLGDAIEGAASRVAYGPWRLHGAPEPKLPDPEGSSSGGESPLVGRPAPDFELTLLDGKPFHLADAKGKVVLLDFWATWCGPCLQAMPQVEAVAKEFEAQGVLLVAVNLQEEPKQIAAMLERHKMHPTVALDRDGVVAQKYEATAIPQTVVIGRDGKVARLFVGSSPHLGDNLREALKAALAEGRAD